MATKDNLERIANALDGGGDFNQGKPDEVGYLERIAIALENGNFPSGGSETVTPIIGYTEDVATRAEGTGAPQD